MLALTNAGHLRYLLSTRRGSAAPDDPRSREEALLKSLALGGPAASTGDDAELRLLSAGFLQDLGEAPNLAAHRLQLARNPLEHLSKVIIEFTTICNKNCAHCCNATVPRTTETDIPALERALDCLLDIGINEYHFIGGEVSAFGEGWLSLASRLRDKGAKTIGVLTNGWFLEKRDFLAAGRSYPDSAALLADWRARGVTHVGFSIDGRADEHDRSRDDPGLYERIAEGFDSVRAAGLEPRVSLLGREDPDTIRHFAELGRRLYGAAAAMVLFDPTNIISNFIDIGNGARREGCGTLDIDGLNPADLRCAGFYRPAPRITLKANGEIASCRLVDAGEGYGNFHSGRLVDILNGMQDSFVYKLHAERKIGSYLPLLDRRFFPHGFDHLCSLRVVLTMLAKKIEGESIDPDDAVGLARANREVAMLSGHWTGGRR